LRTLVTAGELHALRAPVVVLDCRFDLADPAAGERAYAAGHLPGAIYAHLDRDLSGPKAPGGPLSPAFTGRHPLPAREVFAARAGVWGIAPGLQVVACDAQGGPYAARAWWLLRWLGHEDVAVLDGGLQAWERAGFALTTDVPRPALQPPYPSPSPAMPVIDVTTLQHTLGSWTLIDARSPERFRGEAEPLDPVAGRIPGATLRFHKDNLGADGRFKPAAQLRAEFEALNLGGAPVVHQCGSGVTACHNLLAMAHAGLDAGRLYAGSWSEWCADPARPVGRG
jgi:thiosulfate/3-mercaptopyruvate sulfurtransferase